METCGAEFDEENQIFVSESSKIQHKRMNRKIGNVSCTTFNILAPIYKRINSEICRESQFRERWWNRNKGILDMLLKKESSVICLQEFWVGNEELVEMYERDLKNKGYAIYKLGRPKNRGDGLLTAVKKDRFRVVKVKKLLLNDNGDRVAQLLHVQSVLPFRRSQNGIIQQDTLVVNTHLMFPHNSDICLVRLRQVYKILERLEAYKVECKLPSVPIILCGDWNGSKRGHVYKFLRSQGFVSSYDAAHHYTDSDADAHKWVSHRNHRGNICGVDFIWLLNPNNYRKSLKTSWNEAVFGIVKSKLWEAGLKDRDAFCHFKSENSSVDYVKFSETLDQLVRGLSTEEIEDLWAAVDTNRNGIADYEEFQRVLNPTEQSAAPVFSRQSATQHLVGIDRKLQDVENLQESAFGFDVKKAFLFPPEVERGMWPDNYVLSDHAPLTVEFAPVRLPRTHESVC
ncbi:hypothetical protein SUGI_1141330 [Cryptomeria japonica]|nr:hypothetical protein SUGI_1141330 [Cryptomeria japonica]